MSYLIIVRLGGKTNFERARIQMIYDCTTDMTKNLFPILMEQNSTQKVGLILLQHLKT